MTGTRVGALKGAATQIAFPSRNSFLFNHLQQLQLQDDILRQALHLRNVNYVQGRWLSYNLSVIALLCVRALHPPLQMHICITNWGFDSIDKKLVHSFHTYTCILMYGMCYSNYACFYAR